VRSITGEKAWRQHNQRNVIKVAEYIETWKNKF
jgi:hypothetical protein